GSNKIINNAFHAKNQGAGIINVEDHTLSIALSAKRFIEEYACSNKAQNITENKIKIVRTINRSRSILSLDLIIYQIIPTKEAAPANMSKSSTILCRCTICQHNITPINPPRYMAVSLFKKPKTFSFNSSGCFGSAF